MCSKSESKYTAQQEWEAMPTSLDFHKATIMAFKNTLEGKSSKEKEKHISIQIAEQFNSIVDSIKKEFPAAAPQLPQPITMKDIASHDMQKTEKGTGYFSYWKSSLSPFRR